MQKYIDTKRGAKIENVIKWILCFSGSKSALRADTDLYWPGSGGPKIFEKESQM